MKNRIVRKKFSKNLELDDDESNDRYYYIAGYTNGGVAYGVTWEEMGISPNIDYDEKIKLKEQLETKKYSETKNENNEISREELKQYIKTYQIKENIDYFEWLKTIQEGEIVLISYEQKKNNKQLEPKLYLKKTKKITSRSIKIRGLKKVFPFNCGEMNLIFEFIDGKYEVKYKILRTEKLDFERIRGYVLSTKPHKFQISDLEKILKKKLNGR